MPLERLHAAKLADNDGSGEGEGKTYQVPQIVGGRTGEVDGPLRCCCLVYTPGVRL